MINLKIHATTRTYILTNRTMTILRTTLTSTIPACASHESCPDSDTLHRPYQKVKVTCENNKQIKRKITTLGPNWAKLVTTTVMKEVAFSDITENLLHNDIIANLMLHYSNAEQISRKLSSQEQVYCKLFDAVFGAEGFATCYWGLTNSWAVGTMFLCVLSWRGLGKYQARGLCTAISNQPRGMLNLYSSILFS